MLWRGRGSLAAPTCRSCRSTGIRRTKKPSASIGCQEPKWLHCWTCAAPMDKRAGTRYCSKPCQPSEIEKATRGKREVECAWCGKATRSEIRAGRDVWPSCSRFCQAAIRELKQGNTSSIWPRTRPCSECNVDYPTKSNSVGHRCPTCLERYWAAQRVPAKPVVRFVSSQCPRCGTWWVGDRMSGSNTETYCSHRCCRADGKDRRRARKREAFVSPVYRHKVFARDQYRCHICRTITDSSKAVPHPKAPTIDHIIPLAAGGTHQPSNVATACFRCNCIKGHRGGGEQLALIG